MHRSISAKLSHSDNDPILTRIRGLELSQAPTTTGLSSSRSQWARRRYRRQSRETFPFCSLRCHCIVPISRNSAVFYPGHPPFWFSPLREAWASITSLVGSTEPSSGSPRSELRFTIFRCLDVLKTFRSAHGPCRSFVGKGRAINQAGGSTYRVCMHASGKWETFSSVFQVAREGRIPSHHYTASDRFLGKTPPTTRRPSCRGFLFWQRPAHASECLFIFIITSLQSPSPIYVSLGVGPKSFERFVHLPGHPQLVDLYRGVTVFRDVVLYPERLGRPGIFLTIRCMSD